MVEHLTFTFTFIILLLLNSHMYIPVAPLPVYNLINGDEKHIRTLIRKFCIGTCLWFPCSSKALGPRGKIYGLWRQVTSLTAICKMLNLRCGTTSTKTKINNVETFEANNVKALFLTHFCPHSLHYQKTIC